MSIEFPLPARHHHLGESATQPIALRCATPPALLLLVGKSPLRRCALPSHRTQPRSTAESRLTANS
jgi:hypothetical protein